MSAVTYFDLEITPYRHASPSLWGDGSRGVRHVAIPYGRPMREWTKADPLQLLKRAAAMIPTTQRISTGQVRWGAHDGKLEIVLRVGDGNEIGAQITFPGRISSADVNRWFDFGGRLIFADLEEVTLAESGHRPGSRRVFVKETEHPDEVTAILAAMPGRHIGDAMRVVQRRTTYRRGVAVHHARVAEGGAR
jgi:hypothetical protein